MGTVRLRRRRRVRLRRTTTAATAGVGGAASSATSATARPRQRRTASTGAARCRLAVVRRRQRRCLQRERCGVVVGDAASGAVGTVREQAEGNPLAAGLVAFGVGWLVSSLLPASEAEQRAARRAVETAKDQGVVDQAKQVPRTSAAHAGAGQQAAQQVKDKAQDATETVKQEAQGATQDVKRDGRRCRPGRQDRRSSTSRPFAAAAAPAPVRTGTRPRPY